MAETNPLKLTATDLKALVNPTGDIELFQYGGIGQITEAAVITLIQDELDTLLSKLPERYAEIIRGNVRGAILTHRKLGAQGGETGFALPLKPVVSGSAYIYKNYPFKRRPWSDRNYDDRLSPAAYTINNETGTITLNTALAQGDTLVIEYRHEGSEVFSTIRSLALKFARVELYSRYPQWGPEGMDAAKVLDTLNAEIDTFFDVAGAARGIYLIDSIALVEETRNDTTKPIRMPFLGGWGS